MFFWSGKTSSTEKPTHQFKLAVGVLFLKLAIVRKYTISIENNYFTMIVSECMFCLYYGGIFSTYWNRKKLSFFSTLSAERRSDSQHQATYQQHVFQTAPGQAVGLTNDPLIFGVGLDKGAPRIFTLTCKRVTLIVCLADDTVAKKGWGAAQTTLQRKELSFEPDYCVEI